MNSTAEGREAVETALEGFCDSLPSSRLEESSHVKVLYFLVCLCSGVGYFGVFPICIFYLLLSTHDLISFDLQVLWYVKIDTFLHSVKRLWCNWLADTRLQG